MDVRTLCLGALTERAMSGYEIKRVFEQDYLHFFSAGFGSIYPALAELAAEGLVTVENVLQERRPDKKVYRLTEAGRQRFVARLVAAEPREKVRSDFLILIWFAHLLPPERVGEVLDMQVASWERLIIEEIDACERDDAAGVGPPMTPGQRFAAGYGRAVLTAAIAYVRRQRPQLLREIGGDQLRQAAE